MNRAKIGPHTKYEPSAITPTWAVQYFEVSKATLGAASLPVPDDTGAICLLDLTTSACLTAGIAGSLLLTEIGWVVF